MRFSPVPKSRRGRAAAGQDPIGARGGYRFVFGPSFPTGPLARLGLLAAVLVVVATAERAAAQDTVPACGDSLRWRLAWGDGPDRIARGDSADGGFPGPLFDVRDGTVYLLDRLAGRLLVQPPAGAAVRRESLPSLDGISYAEVTDLRVAFDRVFFLAMADGGPLVFAWDPATRRIEKVPLRLGGQMLPPEGKVQEPYKLTLGPQGLYLLQRLSQWSLRIFDGAPVPPESQTPEEGLVLGSQRLRYKMPTGLITTVSGKPLASGSLRATGDGRFLVFTQRDGVSVLELHDLDRGLIARSPARVRERGPAQAAGTRFRLEDGYYELHFDREGVSVVKWKVAGG